MSNAQLRLDYLAAFAAANPGAPVPMVHLELGGHFRIQAGYGAAYYLSRAAIRAEIAGFMVAGVARRKGPR